MSRQIGDAFVTISPDTAGFRALADANIKKALAGINPEIPVKLSIDRNALGQFLSAAQRAANIRANVNMDQAFAAIMAMKARTGELAAQLSRLRLSVSTDPAAVAAVAKLQLQAAQLAKQLADIKIGVDSTDVPKAEVALLGLEAAANKLKVPINMGVALDARPTVGAIAGLQTKAKALAASLSDMRIDAKDVGAEAAIAKLQVQLGALTTKISNIKIGIDVQGFATAESQLLALEATMEKLGPAAAIGDTALGVFTRGANGMGGVLGFLGGRVKLFGGALQGLLPDALASVAVWHIITDVLIEMGAVLIPATLALIAFGVAGSDAAKNIQQRMQAAHTVLDATGLSASKTATAMETLHQAVQPQVYQLFGDAMIIMNSRTGAFASIAKSTGTVVDQLAARFTYAVTSGNGLSTFMRHSTTDVAKLGDIIGNLGGVFGNIFKVIPGFATGLLTLADGFTKILETASRVLEPVTKWVLLLHGYILYTGLAVTASLAFIGGIANLARSFVTFTGGAILAGATAIKDFGLMLAGGIVNLYRFAAALLTGSAAETVFGAAGLALLENPLTWIVVGVALLAGLVFWMRSASEAVHAFADSLVKAAQNAPLMQSLSVNLQEQALASNALTAARQKLSTITEYETVQTGKYSGASTQVTAAYRAQLAVIAALVGGKKQLTDMYSLENSRLTALSGQYGSNQKALGALNAAGITTAQITDRTGHAWAQALIQLNATNAAYQAMGVQGGLLGNDLDVLGRTVTDQYTAVQKLNQAWDAFTKDMTAGQSTFDTVAQGLSTLSDHSGTLRLTLGKLKVSYTDTHAAIDSLTPAGIALNQAFTQQIGNVSAMTDSWRTAGLSQNLFKQGLAASIAPMEIYARGSKEATAQLVGLAEQAGYQGPISLQAMNKYLGITSGMLSNTAGDTQKVKDASNQATIQVALLSGAMKSQGNLIANQLLGDLNQAIIKYYGVSDAVAAYGAAVAQYGAGSTEAQQKQAIAVDKITKAELSMGDNSKQVAAVVAKTFGIDMPSAVKLVNEALARNKTALFASADQAGMTQTKFEALAKSGLGLSREKADELWVSLKGNQQLDAAAAKASTTKAQFEQLASKFHLSKSEADTLWISLKGNQQLDALAGEAGATRGQFEKLGEKFGLTKVQSDQLWAKLRDNPMPKLKKDTQDTQAQMGFFADRLHSVLSSFDDFRHRTAVVFDGIRHDIAHVWDLTWADTIGKVIKVNNDFNKDLNNWQHDIAAWFDARRHDIAHYWDLIWSDTIGRIIKANADFNKNLNNWQHDIAAWFDARRHDIAHYWDLIWSDTIGKIIKANADFNRNLNNWQHDISSWFSATRHMFAAAWDAIWNDTVTKVTSKISQIERLFSGWGSNINNFLNKTLPGYFSSGMNAVGAVWNKIYDILKAPINRVLQGVINPLIGAINNILSWVGIKAAIPQAPVLKKAGGMITGGRPGTDSVLGMLMPGEVVVPTHMVAAGAVDHLRGRLPGFAGGGMVNPIGAGLRPERIDQGVDYGGAGALYAISHGTITNLYNRGWPGGTFIGLRMDQGSKAGDYWYYAEDINPTTNVGATVNAGQMIGRATGGNSGIEVGFAAPPGSGQSMASATGQGAGSTGWGAAASNLIASLGGPAGIVDAGGIKGGTPSVAGGFGGIIKTLAQIFGGLGKLAKTAIDLAGGNITGAAGSLLNFIKPNAGGASGEFARMLLAIPPKLVGLAVNKLVSSVTGFANNQQAASVGTGAAGPGGGAPAANAALARRLMPAWGSGTEWLAWNALEMAEAGWNQFALNPSSGAYGIPQALPASKMGQAANPPQSNPTAQINWMISYIKSVYGDPIGANQHENMFHWYSKGGKVADSGAVLKPGWNPPLYNGTGADESLIPGGNGSDLNQKFDQLIALTSRHIELTRQLINTTASVPAGVGHSLGGALNGAASQASFNQRYRRGGA